MGAPCTVPRSTVRIAAGALEPARQDLVAVEEPLEIRVNGEPIAVTMRMPGDDLNLVAGFLFSEGLLRSIDDLGSLLVCGRPTDPGYGNTVDALAAPGADLDVDRLLGARRGTLTTSACGVCGRRTIEDLVQACGYLTAGPTLEASLISSAPEVLRQGQRSFGATGGTHAAAILDRHGRLLALGEDVGRHNAVDKAVGALLRSRQLSMTQRSETSPAMLVVSGRTSFEMIQKAAMARIPVVAAVSAPTSLAIDLAQSLGMTLASFVRDDRFNLYTHPERIVPKSSVSAQSVG